MRGKRTVFFLQQKQWKDEKIWLLLLLFALRSTIRNISNEMIFNSLNKQTKKKN